MDRFDGLIIGGFIIALGGVGMVSIPAAMVLAGSGVVFIGWKGSQWVSSRR